jgi:hypothetical protein
LTRWAERTGGPKWATECLPRRSGADHRSMADNTEAVQTALEAMTVTSAAAAVLRSSCPTPAAANPLLAPLLPVKRDHR